MNGRVSGEIHGRITGMVRATIDGDVDLNLIAGEIMEKGEGEDEKE